MTFNNRRNLTKQTFEIQKSGLNIHKKHFLDSIEYEISYDLINNKKKIQTTININLLVAGFFFLAIGFLTRIGSNEDVTVIFILISLIFSVFAFVDRKKTITINTLDGNQIELFFNNRNKQDVVEFADQIITASNNYLLKKYSKIDRALPIESQLEGIQYLLNRDIITEEHYESLKNKLFGLDNKSSIGFGN